MTKPVPFSEFLGKELPPTPTDRACLHNINPTIIFGIWILSRWMKDMLAGVRQSCIIDYDHLGELCSFPARPCLLGPSNEDRLT
jgi:hypothetical protein